MRFLLNKSWQNSSLVKLLSHEGKAFSSVANLKERATSSDLNNTETADKNRQNESLAEKYRFVYPEFLPDPNPLYRNRIREKLERLDMLARRSVLTIPEFYVGSVLAVTYSEPHANGSVNKFVGICILREGCGLRASFILRNVVDEEPVEINFDLYDPTIQNIQCLRLEKRLDDKLLYLRDAPNEYSTFPFDMEPQISPPGKPVPVNDIKIPLKDQKWVEKWERQGLKGVVDLQPYLSARRKMRAKAAEKPWLKYDLMKDYREHIPMEEQNEIFSELTAEFNKVDRSRMKKTVRKDQQGPTRPKKNV